MFDAWVATLSPYWRTRIVRGIAAGVLGAMGAAVIGASLLQIMQLDKAIPERWWGILWSGVGIGAAALALTLPLSVWQPFVRLYHWPKTLWIWRILQVRKNQRKNPNEYVYLYDVAVKLLSKTGGALKPTWTLKAQVLTQFLDPGSITSYKVVLESSALSPYMLTIIDEEKLAGSWAWFGILDIPKRSWPLKQTDFPDFEVLQQPHIGNYINAKLTLTGYNDNKQVFKVSKDIQVQIEG